MHTTNRRDSGGVMRTHYANCSGLQRRKYNSQSDAQIFAMGPNDVTTYGITGNWYRIALITVCTGTCTGGK